MLFVACVRLLFASSVATLHESRSTGDEVRAPSTSSVALAFRFNVVSISGLLEIPPLRLLHLLTFTLAISLLLGLPLLLHPSGFLLLSTTQKQHFTGFNSIELTVWYLP
jgi:hypothetical protein